MGIVYFLICILAFYSIVSAEVGGVIGAIITIGFVVYIHEHEKDAPIDVDDHDDDFDKQLDKLIDKGRF